MSKHVREDARKRIVNFCNDAAGGNLKSTVNYFVKQRMKRPEVQNLPACAYGRTGKILKIYVSGGNF